ncbi:MAG: hypothetical protein M1331_00515 [Candidatus Marsarchaeota archaeon]|nr:hypothetical protein [Candidatus Marsarchaeota archaeon]MCL5105869.1 hypothetical protein [Candidatus Marsarchaeota archaeon]
MIAVNNEIISLDKKENGATIDFISHAHTDHMSALASSKNIISSNQTMELIMARIQAKKLNAHIDFSELGIELLNSGHILGASQLFYYDGQKNLSVLYSGDFQMQRPFIGRRIEIKNADILIIDSTYPDPRIKFEEKDMTKKKIQDWVLEKIETGNVFFGSYSLGRAQDIIRILNEIGIVPAVNKQTCAMNRVYKSFGEDLSYVSVYEEDSNYNEIMDGNFVGIVELGRLSSLKTELAKAYKKRAYTAVASGLVKTIEFNSDAVFELSNHADFEQSIKYIEMVAPKKIFTYGANKGIFAKNLAKLGYNASPFESSEFAKFK